MGEVQTDRTNRSLRRLWWRRRVLRFVIIAALSMAVGYAGEFISWPWQSFFGHHVLANRVFACYRYGDDGLVVKIDEDIWAYCHQQRWLEWDCYRLYIKKSAGVIEYVDYEKVVDPHSGIIFSTHATRYSSLNVATIDHWLHSHFIYVDPAVTDELKEQLRVLLRERITRPGYPYPLPSDLSFPDEQFTYRNWWLVFLNGFLFIMPVALGCVGIQTGRRIVIRRRRRHRGLCMTCGYDIRQLDTATCPECGTAFDPAAYAERAL
jgi:hypothetical protein